MMHHTTTVSRSAHADQLEAEVRDARCCEDVARCDDCRAKLDEVRAARRDALLHSVASVRPRRDAPAVARLDTWWALTV